MTIVDGERERMKSGSSTYRSLLAARPIWRSAGAVIFVAVLLGGLGSAWAQGGQGGARAADEPVEEEQVAQDEPTEEDQAAQDQPVEQEPVAQDEPAAKYEMAAEGEPVERPSMGESSLASQERTLPGGALALSAYFVLWVLIFGFVTAIMRRQQKLNAEIAALERRIDEVFEDF